MRKLSERSDVAAEEIGKLTLKIEFGIREMSVITEESVNKNNNIFSESAEIVNRTMEKIDTTMNETKSKIRDITEETGSLATDISGIIISMQFQDITRQRIEHVIEPLLKLKADIEELYTMESERNVLKNTLSAKEKSGGIG